MLPNCPSSPVAITFGVRMKKSVVLYPSAILLGGLFVNPALWASGIYLDFQNGAGTGNAFAGASASAADASTVFYNPAGMSKLDHGHHTAIALSGVSIDSEYKDTGSTTMSAQVPLGTTHSEIHRTALVPAGYYVGTLSPAVQIGLGISPLYANEGSWPGLFAGRYQGSDTKIHVIDYNPSLAVTLSETLSVGVGLNYLDIDAELSRAIPITVGSEYVGDGELTVKGSDSDWGYNLGVLWQATPAARIGLSYRAATALEIEGQTLRSTSATQGISIPGEAEIDVPAMASLALAYRLDLWEYLGDISWSDWSAVPGIYVEHRDTGFELFSEELNFRDGWRAGCGANYQYNGALKLRMGLAYDQSVVPNPQSRTVRFPDNNRKWLGLGLQYTLNPDSTLDIGYAHVFVSDTRIQRQTEYVTPTSQVLRGEISTSGNVLSLQLNQKW